ncbi:hypothetical protein T439DRAFT_372386 [Meredithblackwellia eburnea MCA 4105]
MRASLVKGLRINGAPSSSQFYTLILARQCFKFASTTSVLPKATGNPSVAFRCNSTQTTSSNQAPQDSHPNEENHEQGSSSSYWGKPDDFNSWPWPIRLMILGPGAWYCSKLGRALVDTPMEWLFGKPKSKEEVEAETAEIWRQRRISYERMETLEQHQFSHAPFSATDPFKGPSEIEYLPAPAETVNWSMPSLIQAATGPCGAEFKTAFRCFISVDGDKKEHYCYNQLNKFRNCEDASISPAH